jgi:acyl-CoA reductase-like NAD-dependent aldehyde dehydrogenase
MSAPTTDWHAAARQLDLRHRLFIDGDFTDAADGATFPTLDPATGEVLTEVAKAGAEDIDRAVASARAAADVWRDTPPRARGQILLRLADLMEEHGSELQLTESLDIGKPIRYTGRVDLTQALTTIRFYGEAIDKLNSDVLPTGPDVVATSVREPVGVVGAITPWNFPMMIGAWKIAPALVAGNAVVWKPAEQSPLTALRIAELAVEAGLPEGVLNVVPGMGETAGRHLATHMDVDAIAFTGSTEVGKKMLVYAGESNMKRVSAETGGKTPNIIFADAPDLDFAKQAIGFSIFWNSGEMCVAGSRLLVQRTILDDVVASLADVAGDWQPGDPLDPSTKAGPLVDQSQLDRVLGYVETARSEGAEVTVGGRRVREDTGGYFVEPTVFTGVDNSMRVAQEEIFGPVLAVIPFEDEDEALRIANDTIYGLSASIWTTNLSRAHRFARAVRAGTVWVNNFDQADLTAPFGGFKQSGFGGKDKSLQAIDKYVNWKTTWINIGKGGR